MNPIVSYTPTEAALVDLAAKYKNVVYDVTKPEGMAEAKAAYKEINSHSITLEKAREKEKAESLAYGRHVDAEAKRIAERLDALRLPIKTMIETETKRVEREREEAVRKEAERIAAEEKARKDAEEAKLAAERAELARRQAEMDKAEAEARRKIEDEQRAARLKIEEEARQARLAQQARDEVARVKAEQEAAALKAERDRIDADRREIEERKRKERDAEEARAKAIKDAEEAAARETKRKANELLDANEMLKAFCTRFGHLKQFSTVISAIEVALEKVAA